jgi:thiol-disulfide isomerase/thioredoxin
VTRVFLLGAVLAAGCGDSGGSGADAPPAADAAEGYPPGPYGLAAGDVIRDLQWTGLTDSDDAGELVQDEAVRLFRLSELHADPDATFIMLVAAAEWCEPCSLEAAELPAVAAEFGPRGARIVEAMTQKMDLSPADEALVRSWATTYSLTTAVMIDATKVIEEYWDAGSGYPMTMVIDARTMEIQQIVTQYTTAQSRQLLEFYLP